jgi:hypothetical protein
VPSKLLLWQYAAAGGLDKYTMKNTDANDLPVIGRAERIDLPKAGVFKVPAKVDTGADSSSIWASNVIETADGLECSLFGEGSPFYTGDRLSFEPDEFEVTRVANSFGEKELRYKVKLAVRVRDRLVKGSFTLADRSTKTYPILLGRSLLKGRFVVNVKAGEPLLKEERQKKALLDQDLREMGENR